MKVIVFNLADQEYTLEVDRLKEIVRAGKITNLPGVPDFVEGTIKRRGRVVPIINLRKRLSIPTSEITVDTCIFIIRQDDRLLGLMVDSASEIIEMPDNLIEDPGSFAGTKETEIRKFIKGVAYLGNRFLILLNVEEILSSDVADRLAA